MAGWTYTGDVKPVGINRQNPDGDQKAAAFPALAAGNVGWWQDFADRMGREFARECLIRQTNVATVKVSANNGAGDVNGVGTLTLTIITT